MTQEKFGRYEIKGELGRGGMASVFHAYDPRFERDVAIKVLPREFLHDPQFRARFDREAKMVALLEHPAIVPVYDFGEEEGQPYIVMRYMSGGSLSDVLKKGPLSLGDVVKLITRLAPSLDAAHSKGIIHRDLKPGNILFDQYGNAFLSDFGIARLAQAGAGTLTGGAILGTPAYMSPEQVQGGADIDGRSDIYAMGVILYQVLTGKTPYQADTAAKLMMMHILEPIPSILDEKDDLPPLFEEVIEKAMAKTPETRFQTTAEMAEAVETAAKNLQEVTRVGKGKKSGAGPTLVKAAPTMLSSNRQKTTASTRPVGGRAAAQVPEKKGIPVWVWIGGALALVAIAIAVVLGAGGLVALSGSATETLSPSATVQVVAAASETAPVIAPTYTVEGPPTNTPLPAATDTPAPTSTDTPIPPTDTPVPTVAPIAPILGGADKIAFIRGRDVWVANLDGTELVQLTSDGAEKHNLQWLPDGSGVIFILGRCVNEVTVPEGRQETIVCINFIETLDAFQVSPDGTMVAISMDKQLFIIPFDRAALATVSNRNHIAVMAQCEYFGPLVTSTGSSVPVKQVRWTDDMQHLALVAIVPDPQGTQVQADQVIIYDISQCVANPRKLDYFPDPSRFAIPNYDHQLRNIGFDGQFVYALIGFVRNEGFGDMYIYNSDLRKVQMKINPIGRCCYRDPSFSPDGSYMAFAFQDYALGPDATIEIYVVNFGTFNTGMQYKPLPLPEGFFTDNKESPQPVLRTAPGQ